MKTLMRHQGQSMGTLALHCNGLFTCLSVLLEYFLCVMKVFGNQWKGLSLFLEKKKKTTTCAPAFKRCMGPYSPSVDPSKKSHTGFDIS